MTIAEGIRTSYLAEGLTEDAIAAIVAIADERTFVDLDEIIRVYDEANDIFVLLEGKVRVTTSNGNPIARLKAGAIVGEVALFDKGPRSATVVSEGDSRLARIPSQAFADLMDRRPEIGYRVLKNLGGTLCDRLRSSNVQLESVLAAL